MSLAAVKAGVQEPSLADAHNYINGLITQVTPTTTTTTTAAGKSTTTTTKPPPVTGATAP